MSALFATLHPKIYDGWVEAKRSSPSRQPYTDAELAALRVAYHPEGSAHEPRRPVDAREAVVIWTLRDMLEEQRKWEVL